MSSIEKRRLERLDDRGNVHCVPSRIHSGYSVGEIERIRVGDDLGESFVGSIS